MEILDGVPKTFRINLAVPIIDQSYDLAGNLFYVWSSPNAEDYVDIKVNKSSEPSVRCVRQTGLITPYSKLLITTPVGQAGEMIILYGAESPEFLTIIDNRSVTGIGLTNILGELRGDLAPEDYGTAVIGLAAVQIYAANADRRGFDLQAGLGNAGNIYIGFDNTVLANNAVASLVASGSYYRNDYRGPLWAIASAVGQLLNHSEV